MMKAARRHVAEEGLAQLGGSFAVHVGQDQAGRDGVDGDAILPGSLIRMGLPCWMLLRAASTTSVVRQSESGWMGISLWERIAATKADSS